MEASTQFHAPAALLSVKQPRGHIVGMLRLPKICLDAEEREKHFTAGAHTRPDEPVTLRTDLLYKSVVYRTFRSSGKKAAWMSS
jgi:hypothetical protein